MFRNNDCSPHVHRLAREQLLTTPSVYIGYIVPALGCKHPCGGGLYIRHRPRTWLVTITQTKRYKVIIRPVGHAVPHIPCALWSHTRLSLLLCRAASTHCICATSPKCMSTYTWESLLQQSSLQWEIQAHMYGTYRLNQVKLLWLSSSFDLHLYSLVSHTELQYIHTHLLQQKSFETACLYIHINTLLQSYHGSSEEGVHCGLVYNSRWLEASSLQREGWAAGKTCQSHTDLPRRCESDCHHQRLDDMKEKLTAWITNTWGGVWGWWETHAYPRPITSLIDPRMMHPLLRAWTPTWSLYLLAV